MESKFHQNCVLTGLLDSFCLPCEIYLKINEISDHIASSVHQQKFQAMRYVEKYKGENIRKTKVGYYCEACNMIIRTTAKIDIHVKEVFHVDNKNERLLKRSDGGVIIFDDILIATNSWHGLADGSCLLCDVDYTDEDVHKNDTTHILHLIQSKLELKENQFVYRKIDEDTYNCLVCNTLITKESKLMHSDSSEHKDNYINCKQNMLTKESQSITTVDDDTESNANLNEIKKEICDDSKTNLDKSTLECSSTVNDQVNDKSDEATDDTQTTVTPSEALEKAVTFAKANKLKYKRNSAYCTLCNTTISSSLMRMKEHVAEISHQDKVQNKIGRKLNKVPMHSFIDSMLTLENIFFKHVVINYKYCIDLFSFHMVCSNVGRTRCLACEINIQDFEQHLQTPKHRAAITNTPVLTDFEMEFVREIRPHRYHCGYCNFVEGNLEQMKNHLKSENHCQQKAVAFLHCNRYLPEIREYERKESLSRMMSMFFN